MTRNDRLDALELRRRRGATLEPSPPVWSELHGCYLENHGGLVTPCAVALDEWAARAIVEQARLQIPEDRGEVGHRGRPAPKRASPGALLCVVGPDGRIELRSRIDAMELIASGWHEAP